MTPLCAGNSVSKEEQVDVKTVVLEGTAGEQQQKEGTPQGEKPGMTMAASFVGLAGGGTSAISEAERLQVEEEKMKLYQQLDDKVGWLYYNKYKLHLRSSIVPHGISSRQAVS